ncbi:hypothetical protein N658DRAFT_418686 [Parathielavia hyrcaniae]|uniref:Uncharacterized protein n=1 Tax=Parathielavia hyrcaniae TaxID=113614 RepID=A0AAN6Q7L0_9PEZI|nr:hypothetical protein N658DRAFT_418686 [Parathielavia hyrcaniae]
MYVAGEVAHPSVETTTMVENIVREQRMHMLAVAEQLAARRGEARFTTNDILFQIRHNPGRLARLRHHMRWENIRVKAKSQRSKASIPPPPWSILNMFPHASDIPSLASLDNDEALGDSGLGGTSNPWLLDRLLKDDERTRDMTANECTTWSECWSASFTYRKRKTFREWCGLGVISDHRAKDDALEMLGFLTSEWVQVLTENALAIKEQEKMAVRLGKGEETETVQVPGRPIQPRHVGRAFELLKTPPKRYTAMYNGTRLRQRKGLRIF